MLPGGGGGAAPPAPVWLLQNRSLAPGFPWLLTPADALSPLLLLSTHKALKIKTPPAALSDAALPPA